MPNRPKPEEAPGDHRSSLESERQAIMKSLSITFDSELGAEGQGYEAPAEPEPQYFETLAEAVEFEFKLVAGECDRLESENAELKEKSDDWKSAYLAAVATGEEVQKELGSCGVRERTTAGSGYRAFRPLQVRSDVSKEPSMPVLLGEGSVIVKHDWECTAIGEKGYYFWQCKGCGMTVSYPSPADKFPKDECSNVLRRKSGAIRGGTNV